MKYGSKAELDLFLDKYSNDPIRTKRVQSMIEWATPDRWFIREATDGPVETVLIEKLKVEPDMPVISDIQIAKPLNINKTTSVPVPVMVNATVNRKPPARKPPSFWGKVAQYWNVITGPKVEGSIFIDRFKACTERAGYSWSPINGHIVAITETDITIDNIVVKLGPDETAAVTTGEFVVDGQVIAKGTNKKPCQHLVTINNNSYCGACGCGERSKAELTNKLWYAKVECPRNPPLFKATE